jgi:mRNA interferase RelE/StbE
MLVEVTSSFNKDISKLRDKKLLIAIKATLQNIESAKDLAGILHLKKLAGATNYFRIRVGDYRMGIYVDSDIVTIVRFLHRREVYRYFP